MSHIPDNRICTKCAGVCCQRYSGAYHPDDLQPLTVQSLAARFATGNYAIDWWEGDPRENCDKLDRATYIRPAHVDAKTLQDPSWGGVCSLWSAKGCRLAHDLRPKQCRDLKPIADGSCTDGFSKQAAAVAWLPFQQMIEDAARAAESEVSR